MLASYSEFICSAYYTLATLAIIAAFVKASWHPVDRFLDFLVASDEAMRALLICLIASSVLGVIALIAGGLLHKAGWF